MNRKLIRTTLAEVKARREQNHQQRTHEWSTLSPEVWVVASSVPASRHLLRRLHSVQVRKRQPPPPKRTLKFTTTRNRSMLIRRWFSYCLTVKRLKERSSGTIVAR